MVDRLLGQDFGLPPGAVQAEQGDEILLALSGILTQAFANAVFIAAGVENVVGDLEREAKVLGVSPEAYAKIVGR
jgi:hypothetical protein